MQHVSGPVPHQARPQPGELLARIPAGEHLEHGDQGRFAELGERRRTPDKRGQPGDRPVVERAHRDDLLGQDVQRVRHHLQFFDRPGPGPGSDDGRGEQIRGVGRQEHAGGDRTDLMPGPPDPLQCGGYRRWGTDLDDEVDRPHVDAKLERRRGHHRGQASGVEFSLGLVTFRPAHRPVMSARQDRRTRMRIGPHLVDPGRQPFRGASGVGEHDRRVVCGDQVDAPFGNLRPDRRLPAIGCGDFNRDVDLFGCGRSDDPDRAAAVQRIPVAAEEPGCLGCRPDGRGQSDPLRGCRQQVVQPFE